MFRHSSVASSIKFLALHPWEPHNEKALCFCYEKKPPLPWALASSKAQLDELLTFLGASFQLLAGTSKMKVFHGFLCFMVFNPLKNEKIPWNVPCWSCFFHLHSYAPNPAFAVAKFGSHRATGVLHIWKPCRCAPPKDTFFPVGKSRLGLNSWKVETRNQQFHGTSLMFGKCWDALGKALGFQRRRNCVSHDPKPAEWMGME